MTLKEIFPNISFQEDQVTINETKPEFEGDYTLVLFPFLKMLKMKPADLGQQIVTKIESLQPDLIEKHQIVAGFLNLTIKDAVFIRFLNDNNTVNPQKLITDHKKIMVEYSSPNTNKPLHFGHLRNNFLGWSVSEILKATGNHVIKANLVNDRGIHICKSMVAWMHFGNGATPQSTQTKGDKFVGEYYVKFNDVYKSQINDAFAKGISQEEAEQQAPILIEAKALLRKWEADDEATKKLWHTMNGWVYEGFDATYKTLGLDFDQYYYESETYLLGKELVLQALKDGILYQKEDGSIWIDLTNEGLDHKLLLRQDGTSVYMTQDLGTAKMKYEQYGLDQSIYVIADEQNYHMQVLQLILKKIGEPCADGIYHLSYGMVELPTGRMKSREGTVVDADDMISEMIDIAKRKTEEAGKTEGFSNDELQELYNTIGLGALKFYLLRVDPKKKMLFDPEESIDLHGFTSTFVQYVYARIQSVFRKTTFVKTDLALDLTLMPLERTLLRLLEQYPIIIKKAADAFNPSEIANYVFKVAQAFNAFYDKHSIANAENSEIQQFRLQLCNLTAETIKHGLQLLGIKTPNKM